MEGVSPSPSRMEIEERERGIRFDLGGGDDLTVTAAFLSASRGWERHLGLENYEQAQPTQPFFGHYGLRCVS
jgi:hypothetical protein